MQQPAQELSRVAVGLPGGLDPQKPQYDTITSVHCLACGNKELPKVGTVSEETRVADAMCSLHMFSKGALEKCTPASLISFGLRQQYRLSAIESLREQFVVAEHLLPVAVHV